MDIGDSQSKAASAGYPQTVEVKNAMVNASATESITLTLDYVSFFSDVMRDVNDPRLSYVSKREGCCELQTGLHPPNDLLSVRKCKKRPCTRSFPGNIHSKLDISV